MRTAVFRTLAGLLAVLLAAFLVFGDVGGWRARKLVGAWAVTIGFALFAAVGARGEELLAAAIGIRPGEPDGDPDDRDPPRG